MNTSLMQKILSIPIFLVFYLLSVCTSYANPGCMVGNKMYGNEVFNILTGPVFNSSTIINPGSQCFQGASGACKVCDGNVSLNVLVVVCVATSGKTGQVWTGTYYPSYQLVNCPLDDYAFPLTATAGVLGLFFIRRKLR